MGGGGSAARTLSVNKGTRARRAVVAVASVACVALPFLAAGTSTPATLTAGSPIGASSGTVSGAPGAQLPSLAPWAVPPGGRLVVSAAGFAPGSIVSVRLLPHPVGAGEDLRARAGGTVRAVLTVPGGDHSGWGTVTLDGRGPGGSALQLQAAVRVLPGRQ